MNIIVKSFVTTLTVFYNCHFVLSKPMFVHIYSRIWNFVLLFLNLIVKPYLYIIYIYSSLKLAKFYVVLLCTLFLLLLILCCQYMLVYLFTTLNTRNVLLLLYYNEFPRTKHCRFRFSLTNWLTSTAWYPCPFGYESRIRHGQPCFFVHCCINGLNFSLHQSVLRATFF